MVQSNHSSTRRGGLIVESLTVTGAIFVLSLAAIAQYGGGAEAGRLARADKDIQALCEAEQAVAARHGFYVPLQVLDDLKPAPATRTRRTDDLANEPAGVSVISAAIKAGDAPPAPTSIEAAAVARDWAGPFATPRRIYIAGPDGRTLDALPDGWSGITVRRDYPLDPWGNPYRFYSPIGVIGTLAAKDAPEALQSDQFSDGIVTREDDRFDNYAIVSFGPDGKNDSISNGNDDRIYFFPVTAAAPAGAKN